jgi:hypothetical protein
MTISRLSLLIPFALVAAACGTPTDPSTEPASFVHTVSFGFCNPFSYCSSRLEVSPGLAVLTHESRERGTMVQRRALDAVQWSRVAGALDADGLRALPDVVGCPDCADGGAEALRVVFGDGRSDAVTFEYGHDVAGIQALVDALREIRAAFPPPPPPPPIR